MNLNAHFNTPEYDATINELGDKAAILYQRYENALRDVRGEEAADQFRKACQQYKDYKACFVNHCSGADLYQKAAIIDGFGSDELLDECLKYLIKKNFPRFTPSAPLNQLLNLFQMAVMAYKHNLDEVEDPAKALETTIKNNMDAWREITEKPGKWTNFTQALRNSFRTPHV